MKNDIQLYLYSYNPPSSLDTDYIIEKLKSCSFEVVDRGSFLDYLSLNDKDIFDLTRELSSIQVADIEKPLDSPHSTDITQVTQVKLYDGLWLQRILYRFLAQKVGDEVNSNSIHLILTNILFGTFQDRRYHARVVLMGTPSLISTSGLVEAPAKPREYYYVKGRMVQSGMDTSELDSIYKGRFVEYDDPKMSSILISYVLQVIGYEITGEAFCEDPTCCLSNSHWQEEVLKVQYEGVPCDKCKGSLGIK